MSARKSSHRTIFLIVSSGSPLALIASSLRSTSKKPVCPMTRSFHPPMAHCNQRVRFAATWREEFFEVPSYISCQSGCEQSQQGSSLFITMSARAGKVGGTQLTLSSHFTRHARYFASERIELIHRVVL